MTQMCTLVYGKPVTQPHDDHRPRRGPMLFAERHVHERRSHRGTPLEQSSLPRRAPMDLATNDLAQCAQGDLALSVAE